MNYRKALVDLATKYDCHSIAVPILRDENFLTHSGSHLKRAHHFGVEGLIRHTYEVATIAMQQYEFFKTIHPSLNPRILFTAALYHDYGKVWDYDFNPDTEECKLSDHRRKIHHIQRSALEWNKIAIFLGLPTEFTDEVTHCILSHHGRREWGSPVAPLTREAWILHLSDNISARVDDCDRVDLATLKARK
jgi:3'-5' exoribonuclease